MKNDPNTAPLGERLAGAEQEKERRVLDQILKDIDSLGALEHTHERPSVESPRPRLVLVR